MRKETVGKFFLVLIVCAAFGAGLYYFVNMQGAGELEANYDELGVEFDEDEDDVEDGDNEDGGGGEDGDGGAVDVAADNNNGGEDTSGSEILISDDSPSYDFEYETFDENSLPSGESLMLKAAENVGEYYSYGEDILALINALRKESGLGEMEIDYNLCVISNMRAIEIDASGKNEHTRPNGSSFDTIIAELTLEDITSSAENTAKGQQTAAEIFAAWKDAKSTDLENMKKTTFTRMGLGCCNDSGKGPYWVVIFAN